MNGKSRLLLALAIPLLAAVILVCFYTLNKRSTQVTENERAVTAASTIVESAVKEAVAEKPELDFDSLHSPVNGDQGKYLILGNVKCSEPVKGLSDKLSAFLGRWEGYDYSPPIKKDSKMVVVIQNIDENGGDAILFSGTNLQFPSIVKKIKFKVINSATPSIEAEFDNNPQSLAAGKTIYSFTYSDNSIKGGAVNRDTTGIKLTRDKAFYIYKDYPAYLKSKRISTRSYKNTALNSYGKGYMVYLPEGYEEKPDKKWPMLLFLHGSGDRGENPLVLPKASPYAYIREKGSLPFIIVAPILKLSDNLRSFPKAYLEGVFDEVMENYRVDEKRVYLTGLSMGGEATYRFGTEHPEKFAAIASLAGFGAKYFYGYYINEEAELKDIPLSNLKGVPVWEIHGDKDTIVPLSMAMNTVNDLKTAGVDVKLSVLKDYDHDVWSDTYSDPEFYNWLLQYKKP